MTRRLTMLNACLFIPLALACKVIWEQASVEIRAQRLLSAPLKRTDVSPPRPLHSFSPLRASTYVGIAENNLLSPDRNPTLILEPPLVKALPEPPLPVLSGVILLDGSPPAVLLSKSTSSAKRAYHPGERIGSWLIESFDRQRIVLQYEGKKVTKGIAELMDHAPNKAPRQPAEEQNGPTRQAGQAAEK